MKLGVSVAVVGLVVLGAVIVGISYAQTAISADGVVESTSGGFKFPDGTVQATAAAPGSAPVEDTGQKKCWNSAGTEINCTFTGHDGDFQSGVDWPSPRFSASGGVVTDELTGLQWLQDADCFGSRTWDEALGDILFLSLGTQVQECANYTRGTFNDWRLPNIKELLSLVDYSQSNPALPSGSLFVDVQSSLYWSSSSGVTGPGGAWGVFMSNGSAGAFGKTDGGSVWPVRGGQ